MEKFHPLPWPCIGFLGFRWFYPPRQRETTEKATSDVARKASRAPEALATKSHVQLATWEGLWQTPRWCTLGVLFLSVSVFCVFGYRIFCVILFGHFVGMLIFNYGYMFSFVCVIVGYCGIFLDASGCFKSPWLCLQLQEFRDIRRYNMIHLWYNMTIWYNYVQLWYNYDTVRFLYLYNTCWHVKESTSLEHLHRCRRQVQLLAPRPWHNLKWNPGWAKSWRLEMVYPSYIPAIHIPIGSSKVHGTSREQME